MKNVSFSGGQGLAQRVLTQGAQTMAKPATASRASVAHQLPDKMFLMGKEVRTADHLNIEAFIKGIAEAMKL